MRLILIDKVTPDMKLARSIYYSDNRILLQEGCSNINRFISKLKKYGINYIYVDDEQSYDIQLNDAISEQTRLKSKRIISEAMNDITINGNLNFHNIRDAVSDIIDDLLSNKSILLNLTDIKNNDDYTFAHSVNFAVISVVIGKLLKYNYNELLNLGTGAILHDIGKAIIPNEILNKPGKLTKEEYKIIQEHPQIGFDMIKHNLDVNPLSRAAILTHHEKYDGTGYPKQLKGKDIHIHGRIVAVSDVFDALTSDRIYRSKWPIYQAVEYLTTLAGTQFDTDIVQLFVHNIATFPNGSVVLLSTGEKAIVKEQNRDLPTRPIVRVLPSKGVFKSPREINLAEVHSIVILDVE